MMPVYTHGDSFPHQSNQTGCRAFPTYAQVDPTSPSTVHDPWHCNGGYGYAAPCQSYYNHGYFPGFHGFRPCYPQPPMPPSPVHCYGGYPIPYPEAHHISSVPPLHYSTDLPRYEYDKNRPGTYHCCGCHNHHGQQKEERGLKIEEKGEPDVVAKKGNYKSLIPVETGNYSYPVVWIPQEYLQDDKKPLEPPKVAEQKTVTCETRPNEKKNSQEQEQSLWNGWFPLDADRLKYLLHGGDDKSTQEQKKPVVVIPYNGRAEEVGNKDEKDTHANEDKRNDDQIDRMRQFPLPIVWMPSEDKRREGIGGKDIEEVNGSPKFDGNQPIKFKLIPVKHLGDDNHTDNFKVSGENLARQSEAEVRDNAVTQNNTPLKLIDQPHKDVAKSEDNEKKSVTIKPSGANLKRESSPPKLHKLPPVCLRVDPLPKKKKEKENSRSLSPPAGKERSQKKSNEIKVSQDSKIHESTPVESKKVETKEIMVTEKTSNGEQHGDGPQVLVHSSAHTDPEVSEKLNCEKADEDGDGHQFKEAAIAKEVDTATEKKEEKNKSKESVESGDASKLEKKILSDTEAAVRIQSSYRGFMIRRSEPLKKLKQIAEVREQLVDVRNRLQALVSSSDVQIDEKQKVVIGEIIMRLLLKLDTIQGFLPSLRDIRKSLAKELTTLQEKLDSLMIVKSEESKAVVCPVELVEHEIRKTENNECMSKQEKQEETGSNESSDDVLGNIHGAVESHQDHLIQVVEPEVESQKSSVASDSERKEPDSEAIMEQNDEARDEISLVWDEEPMKTQVDNAPELVQVDRKEPMKRQEVDNAPELVQADEAFLKVDENDSNSGVCSPEAVDASNLDDKEVKLIEDKPIEFENDEQVELKDATVNGGDKAEELMAAHKILETNELAELPTEEIDSDDLVSFAKMENHNACQGTYDASSFKDNTPNAVDITEEVVEKMRIADVDEWVKVESVENKESVMIETPLLSKPEELQTLISTGEEGSQNVVPEDGNVSSISAGIKEVSTEINEKDNENLQLVATEEGIKENQEEEAKNQEVDHIGYATVEKMNDKSFQSEISNEEIAPGLLTTPTSSGKMGSINEKQLTEENEKLREMMEKLIEEGKNQLNVINNLNGKVKNLEKKLSLRRKLSKKNRHSTRRSSSVKCSNVGA